MGNLFRRQTKERCYCYNCGNVIDGKFYDFCDKQCQNNYLIKTDPSYSRKQREESEYYKLWTLSDNLPVPP
jgi:hypothetical protein